MQTIKIPIDKKFSPYVEAALLRVGYLFDGIQIEYSKGESSVLAYLNDDMEDTSVIKEIKYALYREKIYQETIPIRNKIIGA